MDININPPSLGINPNSLGLNTEARSLGIDVGGQESGSSWVRTPDPNSFSSGVGRGVDNLQTDLFSFLEVLGNRFDSQWLEKAGKEGRIRNTAEAAEYGAPISFQEAKDFGDYVDWALTNSGSMLSYALPAIGTTLAGGFIAGGTVAGATAGAAASAVPLSIGGAGARVKEVGGEDAELSTGSLLRQTGMGLLESVQITRLASPLMKKAVQQSVKDRGAEATQEILEGRMKKVGVGAETAKAAAQGAVAGASLATLSTAITEYSAHSDTGVGLDYDDLIYRMKEAAALGTFGGGTLGSVSGIIKAKNMNDFIAGKELDPDAKYAAEPSLFGNKALGRLYNTVVGKPLDNQAHKMYGSESGKRVHKMVLDDLEDAHRAHNAEATHSLSQVEQKARKIYGRKWREKLSDDYQNRVENEATLALKDHYDSLAKKGIERGLLKESDLVDWYTPSNLDAQRILDNKAEFEADLGAQGYEFNPYKFEEGTDDWISANKNLKKLEEYYTALETGDFSSLSKAFDRISDDSISVPKKSDEKLEAALEGDIEMKGRKESSQLGNKQGNLEGHRLWNADQSFYNKWSQGENKGDYAWDATKNYTQRVAKRLALVDSIGKDGVKLNQAMLNMSKELRQQRKEKLTGREWNRIYDVVDAYEGNYRSIQDPTWKAVSQVSKLVVNMAALPLVLLGSLTEPFNIAMKTDMSTMIAATANTMGRFGVEIARRIAFMGPSDAHQSRATQLSLAGQTLSQSSSSILSRLTDPNMSQTTAKIGETFFKMTGLTYWTQFLRNVSAEAARMKIKQDIEIISDPNLKGTKGYRESIARLNELGITESQAQSLKTNSGVPRDIQDKILGEAINKFNRTTVLEPSFADRPLWMSDPNMWMLAQLQGYPTMFTNTVLPMMGHKLKGAPNQVIDGLFIIGAATMVSAMQMTLRDAVANREPREENALMLEAFNRQWNNAAFARLISMLRAEQWGASPVDTVFPVASPINTFADSINAMANDKIGFDEFLTKMAITFTPANAFRGHF